MAEIFFTNKEIAETQNEGRFIDLPINQKWEFSFRESSEKELARGFYCKVKGSIPIREFITDAKKFFTGKYETSLYPQDIPTGNDLIPKLVIHMEGAGITQEDRIIISILGETGENPEDLREFFFSID